MIFHYFCQKDPIKTFVLVLNTPIKSPIILTKILAFWKDFVQRRYANNATFRRKVILLTPWYVNGKKCFFFQEMFPAGIYLLKVNNRNTRTRCEICLKLTIKTSERCHYCRSGVFIVNLEHISHRILVFLLLTLNMYLSAGLIVKLAICGLKFELFCFLASYLVKE